MTQEGILDDNSFHLLEQAIQGGGPEAAFQVLFQKFRQENNYSRLFEARLMKARLDLGLPILPTEPLGLISEEKRQAYNEAFTKAAREAGDLFLADGDIPRAWSYFRAIGESKAVATALDCLNTEGREDIASIIEIAYHEGVHPHKGLELILSNYGICRAITSFQQYPGQDGRENGLRLLVSTIHHDLVESLKRAVERAEGQAPQTNSISSLIAGRDWLFEGNNYYIDTSHVVSVIQFSIESDDREILSMALELTDYGRHLSPMYEFRGNPPFQNVYEDYGIYLGALLGKNVDQAVAHFREKVTQGEPSELDSGPAQVLVALLSRLNRYHDAIEVSLQYLRDFDSRQVTCMSVPQLCQKAKDYELLMKFSREQGDLLTFTAGAVQMESNTTKQ
jgi:hypothetical protein